MNINAFFSAAAAAAAASGGAGAAAHSSGTRDNTVARQLLLTFLSNLRGEIVLIEKTDGTILDGLFDSFSIDDATNTYKINLLHAIVQPRSRAAEFYTENETSPTNNAATITCDCHQQYAVVYSNDLKQIMIRRTRTRADPSVIPTAAAALPALVGGNSHHTTKAFATDTEISKAASRRQRELETWKPNQDDRTNVLDESILHQSSAGDWDQFAANARLMNVPDSALEFDMNEYSTYLDVNSEFYKQHEAEARAVEESILRGTSYKGSKVRTDEISRRERRSVELQQGEDEDKAFSAVITPSASTEATNGTSTGGKYIPPNRSRAAQAGGAQETRSSDASTQPESCNPTPAQPNSEPEMASPSPVESAPTIASEPEKKPESEAAVQTANDAQPEKSATEAKTETKEGETNQSEGTTTENKDAKPKSKLSKLSLQAAEYRPSFLSSTVASAPNTAPSYSYVPAAQYAPPPQPMVLPHPAAAPGGYVSHVPQGYPIAIAPPQFPQGQVYAPGIQTVPHPMGPIQIQAVPQGYVVQPPQAQQSGYVFRPAVQPGPVVHAPHATMSHVPQSGRRGDRGAPPSAMGVIAVPAPQAPVYQVDDGTGAIAPVTMTDAQGNPVTYIQSFYPAPGPQGQPQVVYQPHYAPHTGPRPHSQGKGAGKPGKPAIGSSSQNGNTNSPSMNPANAPPQSMGHAVPAPPSTSSQTATTPATPSAPVPPHSATPSPPRIDAVPAIPVAPSQTGAVPVPPVQATPSKPNAQVATTTTPSPESGATPESSYVRIVRKDGAWSTSTASQVSATPSHPQAPAQPQSLSTSPKPIVPLSPTPMKPSGPVATSPVLPASAALPSSPVPMRPVPPNAQPNANGSPTASSKPSEVPAPPKRV